VIIERASLSSSPTTLLYQLREESQCLLMFIVWFSLKNLLADFGKQNLWTEYLSIIYTYNKTISKVSACILFKGMKYLLLRRTSSIHTTLIGNIVN
jgi:hypothetical protein